MKTNQNINKNSALNQWEKRVVTFKFLYSILIDSELSNQDIKQKITNELPDDNYIISIINNYLENQEQYKQLLQANLKQNWTVDRLEYIDQAVIFCAISEFNTHKIDKKVIIDQAIITSKKYGSDNSYKFINYILDKVIK